MRPVSNRSRCGTTVYFGSFAGATPASMILKRMQAEPAASARASPTIH